MQRRIRNSSITKFLRCRRSWSLSYLRNLETAWNQRMTPQTFDCGNAVHRGLEALVNGQDWMAAIDEHWAEIQGVLAPEADYEKWIDQLVTMPRLMVEGYIEWREEEGIDIGYETLGTELPYEANLGAFHGDDVILYGTIDRLLRNPNGQLVIDDYKTVATLDSILTLPTNWQINNYDLLTRVNTGEDVVEARHTQLKRVKRTARAKPPFYGMLRTTFNQARRDSHWLHLAGVVDEMVSIMQRIEVDPDPAHHMLCPPNPTRDCSWDCAFKDVCPSMDNGSDWEFQLEVGFRQREDVR